MLKKRSNKNHTERNGTCVGISDLIASFLQESLDEAENGVLEVQRNDLAQRFNCVPSQINYVMSILALRSSAMLILPLNLRRILTSVLPVPMRLRSYLNFPMKRSTSFLIRT